MTCLFSDYSLRGVISQYLRSYFLFSFGVDLTAHKISLTDLWTVKIANVNIGTFLVFETHSEFNPGFYWTVIEIVLFELVWWIVDDTG